MSEKLTLSDRDFEDLTLALILAEKRAIDTWPDDAETTRQLDRWAALFGRLSDVSGLDYTPLKD